MYTIRVERTLQVPIDQVFAVLSDHANYHRFPGIRGSRLLRPGTDERNGVGAVREIRVGPSVLEEEIILYEPPYKLGYRMIRSRPIKVNHVKGQIDLRPAGDATHAVWESVFEIQIPWLGSWLEQRAGPQFERGFQRTFAAIEQQYARAAA
ncbi:MAG: hypothetical protein Tsb002_29280 [Wenzhouxiangellaceae bacterium]